MAILRGRPVIAGEAKAPTLVSSQPVNLLASYSRALILKKKKGILGDRNHPFLGKDATGMIMVIPQTIGSTTGGLVLLEALQRRIAPRAVVCEEVDSLLASGAILAEVWYGLNMPLVDRIPWAELIKIRDGQEVEIKPDGTVIFD